MRTITLVADHSQQAKEGRVVSRIAFLGAGNMGQAMVRRLLGAGHSVMVYNRSVDKANRLIEAGATVAASPRLAANGADAVLSCVSDDEASRAVWTGADGALSAEVSTGAIAIECSTLSHDWVLELAEIVAMRGLPYIDCPVAGRPDAAAAGQLNLFVGATEADLAAARSLLVPLCKRIFHFGPVGTGTAFKLIYNLLGASQIAALAEAMVVAEAVGIDLQVAAEAFSTGATGSPHVTRSAAVMARGERGQPVAFSGRWRLKDSVYGVRLADKMGQQAVLGKATVQVFEQMVKLGMGTANDSELIDALRSQARLEVARALEK
jgi:3-hydroxyisobutyrate dehydrogenase